MNALRVLACGDLHLTDKCPGNRMDDYGKTVLSKFEFILKMATEEKCATILQPADFFDGYKPSYQFWAEVYRLIDQYEIPIFTMYGQHDLRQRNTDNTGLYALAYTNQYVCLIPKAGHGSYFDKHIYGSPYGQPIPPVENEACNILMAHRMVVKKKLWEAQTNFEYGTDLLDQHPEYSLIITGDNHQNFIIDKGDRVLINAGSMMRSTIAQIDHKPSIYVVDIKDDKIQGIIEIDIPIEPAEKVFRMDSIARENAVDENLVAYIEGLKGHKSQDLLFEDDLNSYVKENNTEDAVIAILEESKGDNQ